MQHNPPSHFLPQVGDADECIKCRPDWVKGYFRRAAALEAKGDLDAAEKSFNDALKREEGNVYVLAHTHAHTSPAKNLSTNQQPQ